MARSIATFTPWRKGTEKEEEEGGRGEAGWEFLRRKERKFLFSPADNTARNSNNGSFKQIGGVIARDYRGFEDVDRKHIVAELTEETRQPSSRLPTGLAVRETCEKSERGIVESSVSRDRSS